MARPPKPEWTPGGGSRPKRASSHDRLLAHASELFVDGTDLRPTLDAIARLVVPRLGDVCVVDIVEEAGNLARAAVASTDPEERDPLQEMRTFPPPLGDTHPAMQVLRTGRSVVIDRIDDTVLEASGVDADARSVLRRLGITSSVSVPITARGRILGVISFGMIGPDRAHSPDDLQFAERLGRHAGLALDNARLYEAERRARREAEATAARLTRVERLTGALAEALDPAQVARTVLNHALPTVGAAAGAVLRLDEEGNTLALIAAEGYPPEVRDTWAHVPLDHASPLPQAVRTGQPVLVPSHAAWERDFPDAPRVRAGSEALVAWPLLVHGRVIGALGLSLDVPGELAEADRSLLGALADQCAQALDRAELYQAERAAREGVEQANARLRLLADAQQQFVEASHDCHAVLGTVARRLAEEIGDACTVRLLSDDRQWLEPPTIHHGDRAMAATMQNVAGAVRARADAGMAGQVLATGRPMLAPELSEPEIEARFAPELRPIAQRFPIHSMMIAPLRTRGESFGVIELTRHGPGRPYRDADLVLLDQLAQRAAMAIAKARLLEAERASRAQAEEAVRMRDEYLATITHDLRTPLNTVSMGTILLEQEMGDGDPLRRHVAAIRRGVASMDQLIEDLVDLSRLERGSMHLERAPTDLRPLLDEVRELLAPHAGEQGLELALRVEDGDLRADCDRKRIGQVLINLVGNAIKFTPEGGTVTLGARPLDGQVELYVSDTGAGISEEARRHMFERYWTAEPARGAGQGLGLSIVRGLLEAHGIRIEVDSEAGRGSTFHFRLPRPT